MVRRVNLNLAILDPSFYLPVCIIPFYDDAGEFHLGGFDLHEVVGPMMEHHVVKLFGEFNVL